jgi:hypothetical protein
MTNIELLTAINDHADNSVDTINNGLHGYLQTLEKANAKINSMLLAARMKKLMKDFGERDTDIYVVTYQKSGTTLTQMVLYQMTTNGSMDFEHLYEVSPWCRYSAFTNREMRSAGERRVIKTHDEYEMLKNIKKGKFVFVIRDCLDVISSLHEHIKDYSNPSVDFTELSNRKMKDWFEYNAIWMKNENNLDILYIHYEDLITDKREAVMKMAAFLDITINEETMERVIDRTSFEFMKKNESKFGEQPEHWKVYNNFIRKGKAGEGKVKFTTEQLESYKTRLQEYGREHSHIQKYL